MNSINKALVVVGAAGALALSSAATASASVHTSQADILYKARINFLLGYGTIALPVQFQCWDPTGLGMISAAAQQTAAQSATGQAETGSSPSYSVNCDGKKHTIALNVIPQISVGEIGHSGGFNLGKATAWAQLTAASGSVSDQRTIKIVL